jgi:hypothetical protein
MRTVSTYGAVDPERPGGALLSAGLTEPTPGARGTARQATTHPAATTHAKGQPLPVGPPAAEWELPAPRRDAAPAGAPPADPGS